METEYHNQECRPPGIHEPWASLSLPACSLGSPLFCSNVSLSCGTASSFPLAAMQKITACFINISQTDFPSIFVFLINQKLTGCYQPHMLIKHKLNVLLSAFILPGPASNTDMNTFIIKFTSVPSAGLCPGQLKCEIQGRQPVPIFSVPMGLSPA